MSTTRALRTIEARTVDFDTEIAATHTVTSNNRDRPRPAHEQGGCIRRPSNFPLPKI
ncbi:hypothetical protein M501DRAFT_999925 [Patellaria atrata CBS 101060]|uniref:Uncharacterized protein n=1 Tax=Patellaria atrata CBS 101060 TaxID=1346257 RepID=A0A9P4S1U5_9PEZI|nr:hypothetical protein M501DRAFT_999925 [Patellaria atrata CBS 101060]